MTHVPWAHQQEALDLMASRPAFALLMAMRTGKSLVLLHDYDRLERAGLVRNLMVIAPAGVYETWLAAAQEELTCDALYHVWHSGAGAKEKTMRRAFAQGGAQPRVLIMNVEALSTVEDARIMARDFLHDGDAMLAVDESTTIKNSKAMRTKYINRVLAPIAKFRRILSGLPSPKSPLDLYTQFEFLDPAIIGAPSYWHFEQHFAQLKRMVLGRRRVWKVVGYKNIDELSRMIAPYSYRKTLEDVYDLPESMYVRRSVSMPDEQRRMYDELRDYATAQISATEHVTATIVIVQMLRLHQLLCGHTVDEAGEGHDVPEARTKELVALLNEYDGKAIVWVSYDRSIHKVQARLEKEFGEGCVARFWGGNRTTREAEEKRFLTDPDCRYMVATPAAGGRGRTWHTAADLVVYYSSTNNLEDRAQSEERAKGVGKTKSVLYVDLVAEGTVDEKIIDALRAKQKLSDLITGDAWREWIK